MPITRIDRDPLPYVRPAYEPDTRTLAQLMALVGQSRANQAARQGAVRAQNLMTLGQIIGGGLASLREERTAKEAAAVRAEQQAREDAFKARDQQLREADLMARMKEREDAAAERAQAQAYKRGTEVADEVGYGPMSEPQMESILQGPAAGRARYSFGPGTAEGPELMPTRPQQRAIDVEKSINAMGGQIGPNGQVVMPPKVEQPPTPESRLSGRELLAYLAQNGNQGAAKALQQLESLSGPKSENEPLVPIVGPDGKTRYGTRAEARGSLVPAGQNKPATGLEKRTLNFFNRAQQADVDLEQMEPAIAQLNLAGQTYMQWAPNFMQTDLGQRYTQAQRAFTEARLRKDSGAAIPPAEYENDRQTYFAQPGDSPQTLEQKRRARATILASLGFESGQALGEFLGDPDEASRMVQGYKARATNSGGALKVRMIAPDGSTKDVDPSEVEHYKARGAKVQK